MVLRRRAAYLIFLFLLMAGTVAACREDAAISGLWRSAPPVSLLYEYRDDGTVFLYKGDTAYQVFRYELSGDNSIRLYDGMGRRQEFDYQVLGDTLTFYHTGKMDEVTEVMTRVKQ